MFESDASNSLMFSLLDKLKIINKNMISKNKGKMVINETFLFTFIDFVLNSSSTSGLK